LGKLALGAAFVSTIIAVSVAGAEVTPEISALEVPLRQGADASRVVLVDISPSEVCHFGDLDLVLNDLGHSQGKLRLQLSVEELGKKDGIVVYGEPLEKKFEGENMGSYNVRLPAGGEPKVFGVFLCSVTPEELAKVPCSTKRLLSFAEMFEPYRVDVKPLMDGKSESAPYISPTEVESKIYFSQFLIDNGKRIVALKDSASKDGEGVLRQLGMSEATSTQALPLIQKFSSTLGSLPFGLEADRLQMVLPYFSDKKCNG
jgi:hypothetical protein